MTATPRTLYQKIWDTHVVHQEGPDFPALIYIDRHLIHEVTSPQAFSALEARNIPMRRPDLTVATVDHSIPTVNRLAPWPDEEAVHQVSRLEQNVARHKVPFYGLDSGNQGIVHVVGPELGFTLPGTTIVCGDSHTATHGAFGALAFGIGTSEVEHVFATQCLLQYPSKTMAIEVSGQLQPGVTAKDLILAIIAQIGVDGGTGYVLEYRGPAITALSMEGRMTLCNMSIEAGARAGMVAPDSKTFEYLAQTPNAPQGAQAWDKALAYWQTLPTDEGATFDAVVHVDGSAVEPMVTYGTNPAMGCGISKAVPSPATLNSATEQAELTQALDYMGLKAGQPLAGLAVDVVFIGSCTNGRIEDMRQAAEVVKGRKANPKVRSLVVPGSMAVQRQAVAEGLDTVFTDAGLEWREPGCSMCIAMNGDMLQPGQVCASTSNRNFKGRQGKGGRTLLMSPAMAAAAAIEGHLVDVRQMMTMITQEATASA